MAKNQFRHHPENPPRIIAELSAAALKSNFNHIARLAPNHRILPMIKADAYGHGSIFVAQTLASNASIRNKLYGLGVATFKEALELRVGLPKLKTPIFVFSDSSRWTDAKGSLCLYANCIPILATLEDLITFTRNRWHERISFHLKFNTGMNRLGIESTAAMEVIHHLHKTNAWKNLTGVLSHLASGEAPETRASLKQRREFGSLTDAFKNSPFHGVFHLANSAGIWNFKRWKLAGLTQVVRPGLAIYGIQPAQHAPTHGIKPVMTLKARVLQVHAHQLGDKIGYGGRFTVREKKFDSAVLATGYADGLHRMLSSRGKVWLSGKRQNILGNISMDLTSVRCDPKTKPGDWAELLGPKIDIWAQAALAGTLPYELFTSISKRVDRHYVR